jgi:hypothetical protein
MGEIPNAVRIGTVNIFMYGIIFNGYNQDGQPDASRAGGGYRIATHLRNIGWDIEVVDYFTYWNIEDLKQLIDQRHRANTIKWIGISSTWMYRHPNVADICAYIKHAYPEIKIIFGGNQNFNIDMGANYYVYGFGERAIEAILHYEYSNGQKPYGRPHFKGWSIDALTFYPAWPLDSYVSEYEDRDFLVPDDIITVEIGRGCRFKCKFCNFPVLGLKEDTSMSEEEMYRHFSSTYEKWGITTYNIADETINERSSKLEKMAKAVERCDFELNFSAFTRLDLFNSHPEMIELMARARIWGQFYGVETFNHRSGKIIGKGLDPEINKQLMLKARDYTLKHVGLYRGTASFIAGLPYETDQSLKESHTWLANNWRDQNWMFWALTIPADENFRLSAFGEDLSAYGYSVMSDYEIDEYINTHKNLSDHERQGLGMLGQVIWKNNHGNYFTFHEQAKMYDSNSGSVQCKEGNFNVWSALSLGIQPKVALLHESSGMPADYFKILYQKVNSYIQKKLAL